MGHDFEADYRQLDFLEEENKLCKYKLERIAKLMCGPFYEPITVSQGVEQLKKIMDEIMVVLNETADQEPDHDSGCDLLNDRPGPDCSCNYPERYAQWKAAVEKRRARENP